MKNYYNDSWIYQDKLNRTNILKRIIYFFGRPLLSIYGRYFLSTETLRTLKPSLVLPGRGMPMEDRRFWGAAALSNIREATVLVQGTGTGWDVISWARLKPKKIIATDLFEFQESWNQIVTYCKNSFGVTVEFHKAPLEDHSFLVDGSIDLCASDNVFEHCKNLRDVLQESFRILKPGGILYAAYDPLWFCAGGDHFSGRGGLDTSFNHILLSQEEYKEYFDKFLQDTEDFQSGGRYVEIDLFSKLTTKEYYDLYQDVGFLIDNFMLGISSTSLDFKKKYPDVFETLISKYSQCVEDDFLIKANFVRLIKPSK
jgi:SAM-dependent methyltransferase